MDILFPVKQTTLECLTFLQGCSVAGCIFYYAPIFSIQYMCEHIQHIVSSVCVCVCRLNTSFFFHYTSHTTPEKICCILSSLPRYLALVIQNRANTDLVNHFDKHCISAVA